jgi:Asp-tRNA(Asn)/Glu-tRNA(Gln) amidotransferase A subunit family amidase
MITTHMSRYTIVNISETLVSVSPVTKAAEDMYRFSDTISNVKIL